MKAQLLFWLSDFLGWLGEFLDAASMICTEAGWYAGKAAYKANGNKWREGQHGNRR